MSRSTIAGRWLPLVLAAALVLTGCADRSGPTAGSHTSKVPAETTTTLTPDQQAVQSVLRASVAAENAKDANAFLAIWTDKASPPSTPAPGTRSSRARAGSVPIT